MGARVGAPVEVHTARDSSTAIVHDQLPSASAMSLTHTWRVVGSKQKSGKACGGAAVSEHAANSAKGKAARAARRGRGGIAHECYSARKG